MRMDTIAHSGTGGIIFHLAFCSGIGTVGGAEAMSAVGRRNLERRLR